MRLARKLIDTVDEVPCNPGKSGIFDAERSVVQGALQSQKAVRLLYHYNGYERRVPGRGELNTWWASNLYVGIEAARKSRNVPRYAA